MSIPPLLSSDAYDDYLSDPQSARVDAVTAFIRGRCGWHIAPSTTETVTLDGPGIDVVSLPSLHVTAVTSVVENSVDITSSIEWSAVGLLRHPRRWTGRWRAIVATFTHGYPEVPADLAKLVAEAAARLPAPGDRAEKKIGPFEYFVDGASFTADELAVIDRYRILVGP